MLDFDETTLLAEMQVSFDFQNRRLTTPARFVQHLKPYPHVIVRISDFPWDRQLIRDISSPTPDGNAMITPALLEGPCEIQLESGTVVPVVPTSLLTRQKEIELHLRQRPSVVLNLNEPMNEIRFEVMNFTGDVLQRPGRLATVCWNLELTPVKERSKLVGKLSDSVGFGVTHEARLTRNNGGPFRGDEVQSCLNAVDTFLSFLCGSACATTNVAGMDAKGNVVWRRWGPHHVSAWKRQRSWTDITMSHELSGLFAGFMGVYLKNPEHIGRIIRLYVASNENDSVDMSIIMNQIAFEMILMDTEKHRKGKLGGRIAEMLSSLGIEKVIPDSCDGLLALTKKHRWAHGPHALVDIRNSLVHADKELGPISIDAYYEAKQLGLWYLELLLLRSLGYQGKYGSRLKSVQMAGDTEQVPWARQST